eukprot:jgi/Botrbrau1/10204/Bobra.116_1s0020.1
MAETKAPLSFAAVAEKKAEKPSLRCVQLDGHVVLKITKHCRDNMPNPVSGQLLGLDVGPTLEVTDCFPFLARGNEEDESAEDSAAYQLDMMRCLREVNVDNNTVGWYQSTMMGSYQTLDLIETFMNYHESIRQCICIVYDPQHSSLSGMAIKAVKLRDSFIGVYKQGGAANLTSEKLKAANVSWQDVFEEIPVHIHNSVLASALMLQIEPQTFATQGDFDRLGLNATPMVEKSVEFLNDCLEEVLVEQQKVSYHHRNVARQQQQLAQWQQKRRQENNQRRLAGEEPLPEEDPILFKPIIEPSPLEGYLITNQINNYCDQLVSSAAQSLEKLYLSEGFQKPRAGI